MCMQRVHQWSGDTNLSEDCLYVLSLFLYKSANSIFNSLPICLRYLNIFLPGTGTGSHVPVRVWIHGGGFLSNLTLTILKAL